MALNPDYRYQAVVTRVVDGDTFDACVDLGFHVFTKIRFRLANIDPRSLALAPQRTRVAGPYGALRFPQGAPETYGVKKTSPEYQAGLRAKDWLTTRIEGRKITLVSQRAGKFGRWLAIVYIDGTEVNFEMIDLGLAEPY